jgi:peptide/nickel transport system permease protein
MLPFLQFSIRRFLTLPVSLLIITLLLYAGVMLTPVETRARLYLPPGKGGENASQQVVENYKEKYHLNDPYLVQYGYWIQSLVQGKWGYSPTLNEDVLPALLHRTPATTELALYSMILFIPLGLISGTVAGWKQREAADNVFRLTALVATSLPPFILALILIAFFYAGLNWFATGRLSNMLSYQLNADNFQQITGLYTLDGLLNNRLDVTLDALRHLVMPAVTLAFFHWATLARITRTTMNAEKHKEYIIAARARGVHERNLMWKHAFRNVLAPSMTSLALSAASLVTGVFVVEIIFSYKGVSDLIVKSMQGTPDAATALGFAVYSVIIVLLMMFALDVIQALLDPRVRDEVLRT